MWGMYFFIFASCEPLISEDKIAHFVSTLHIGEKVSWLGLITMVGTGFGNSHNSSDSSVSIDEWQLLNERPFFYRAWIGTFVIFYARHIFWTCVTKNCSRTSLKTIFHILLSQSPRDHSNYLWFTLSSKPLTWNIVFVVCVTLTCS